MPLEFHKDRSEKIKQQYLTAKEYIVPFIEQHIDLKGKRVLEVGCGEGGILQAFWEKDAQCVGFDIESEKIEFADEYYREINDEGRVKFLVGDVYELVKSDDYIQQFDLVILKDTIEHIHGKEKLMSLLPKFLKDESSLIFIGFPPWQNPFGGHQQMCDTKLKFTPWIHLLPKEVYRAVLTLAGERLDRVEGLIDAVETRLTIETFERIARQTFLDIADKKFYLINPIYKYKFKLDPIEQVNVISEMPYLRGFLTTTCYYLLKKA
ncbi:MAG: methyltransferase domain-containing protein [Candidatus Zophobacter franzmannii]|nr:methyltransferase domain-containing protein [Candidatus Zophobacter franzmannii]